MKLVALFVLSGVAAFSCASFDMLLLPSLDGKIYRYDPVNEVGLGSFRTGITPILSVDGSTGTSFAGTPSGSSLYSYQYSIGEMNGIFTGTASAKSAEYYNGAVYGISSSTIRRTNIPSNTATTVSLAATMVASSMSRLGNYIHVFGVNSATNAVCYQVFDTTTNTLGSLVNTSAVALAGSSIGKAAVASNSGTGANAVLMTYVNGAGSLQGLQMSMPGTGLLTSTSPNLFFLAGYGYTNASYNPAVVAGHNGVWMIGTDSSDTTKIRITRMDMFTGFLYSHTHVATGLGSTYTPITSSIFVPANVVAPEPGAFAAMGIGMIGLALRRRKKD